MEQTEHIPRQLHSKLVQEVNEKFEDRILEVMLEQIV